MPEPLQVDERDAACDVVLAESVSMAMLVLLESLKPDERAVFVLREVFGFEYDEIAGAVGKSAPAVRQVAHRAREYVQARCKRFHPADAKENVRIAEQFLAAAATGDMDGLMKLLAPDVTCIADGGGRVGAARRPLVGAAKVAAAFVRLVPNGLAGMRRQFLTANGAPAVALYLDDRPEGLLTVEIIGGKITQLYAIANPDKLATFALPRRISREIPRRPG